MKIREIATSSRPSQVTISLLGELFRTCPHAGFAVRLWNGTTWRPDANVPCCFTLVLTHPGSLRKMLDLPSALTMAEAYIFGDVDIEGDMEAAYWLGDYMHALGRTVPEKIRLGLRLHTLPKDGREIVGRHAAHMHGSMHSEERDRQAISYHYNTSNEFFGLWLDKQMVYSTAYFKTPGDDLETAQEQKLGYICKKLRLLPGDRLLDLGCGWGGLAMYAAREFGVHVLGVTISSHQAELAASRIQKAGLSELCKVEIRDYREIDQPSGFDKIVSVGMFEHVGESHLPQYFYQVWRLLRPGGVFLNHGIARDPRESLEHHPTFISRYVFPDGETIPLATTLAIAGKSGFEVRDIESLREHYVLTLRRWVARLEQHHDQAVCATDETTYRIWRLFMAGSAHSFAKGKQSIYQTLFAKSDDGASGLPLTRADWYMA